MQRVGDKIRRIRRPSSELSPAWTPQRAHGAARRDPWIKRLAITAAACVLVAILLFVGFHLSLGSGVSGLEATIAREPGIGDTDECIRDCQRRPGIYLILVYLLGSDAGTRRQRPVDTCAA